MAITQKKVFAFMTDVTLTLGVDDSGSIRQLDRFRKAAAEAIKVLQQPVGRISAFQELQASVEKTGGALRDAKGRLRDMQQELVRLDSANAKTASSYRQIAESIRAMESNAKRLDALQFGQRNLATARDRVRDLGNELARANEPSKQLQDQYSKALAEYQKLQRTVRQSGIGLSGIQVDPRALADAKRRLAELGGELQRGTTTSRQLQGEYKLVTAEMNRLATAAASDGAQLERMRTQLRAAGVDTRDLAGEQARLRSELARQVPNIALQSAVAGARESLGVRPFIEVNAEITRLQRNYALLKSSGQLTSAELIQAQVRMLEQTRSLEEQTNGWRTSLARVKSEILAGAAAFGGLALLGRQSFNEFANYSQQLAGIATITDLTGNQLQTLSLNVRQLSTDMGKGATESAAALREILGAGIESGRSLDVLAQASKAAVAGMSETKTAASVGVSIVNAYGESVDNLGQRYDQLFLTIRDGVVEFDELAAGLGQVLPAAAAAGVGFDEIGAALARMTVQGIKAPIAITSLRSAITQLASPAPEAAKAMDALGIRWNGLQGTLQQIADRKLGAAAMRQIVPDIEGRTAVLALTNNIEALNEQIERMDEAAGATQRAYDIMKDTPAQQVARFKAAVGELQLAFGQALAAGLPLVNLLTDMLNSFNELPESVKLSLIGLVALGVAGKAFSFVLSAIRGPFSLFLTHLSSTPPAAAAAGTAIDVLGARFGKLGAVLGKLNLGKALRLGGYGIIAGQLYELYQLHSELQELEKSQEDYARSLDQAVIAGQPYRDTLVLTAQEVSNLTETERNSYLERLKNAQMYYSKLAEQISRADMEKNGSSAPVSDEALAAARQAREYQKAYDAIEQAQKDRLKSEESFQARQDAIRKSEIDKVKSQLSDVLNEHEKANKRLEQVRKRREEIQKRFANLADSFAGGAQSGTPTFADLTQAKVNARNAARAGDTETAIREAERAAKILEQLRDAGANTYGFGGIARELGQIADAAAKIDEENAEAALKAQEQRVESLVQKAEALKRISVGFVSDTESEEQTRQRMLQLADEWRKYMQVQITLIPPDTSNLKRAGDIVDGAAGPAVPGYATGGVVSGPGTGTSDSIWARISNGEGILTARAVQHYGPELVYQLNRLRVPKFAEGGVMGARNLPSIPAISPSLLQSAQPTALGTLNFHLPGGEQFAVQVAGDNWDALHKASLKYGGTARRKR
ncbi:phage tail tape measure protein [Pseudomonas boanensis]|uniref:phage tail tape measure protein n=1 Tax=Metapseudomonas boanensis TaxID=2822138 RepID=UPI0035D3F9F7